MEWTNVVVAVITAVGALLGTYFANRKSAALIEYRLQQLEERVRLHNNLVERMYTAEQDIRVHDEKINVANHRIADLERGQG